MNIQMDENEQVNLTLIFYIKLKKLHKSLDMQKDI